MSELFYVFGIGLTLLALVVAFVGMRMESFPSRQMMVGGLALMTFLVVGSTAFAIVLAREEQEHRSEEIAEFREEEAAEMEAAAAEAEGGEESPESEQPVEVEPDAPEGVELTSPAEGDLVFEPVTLEADAGEVTLNYVNPSQVPHNVAIEEGSETVAQGETVTGGDAGPATADLESGEYAYYCSVPSHREAGMEGVLTVE